MKALVLNAQWAPKTNSEKAMEKGPRKVINASLAWKNPILGIQDVPVPEVAGEEVLIEVRACGICGSDTHCYEKNSEGYIRFSGQANLPVVLGHELSGVVVKVGEGVRTLKAGDPVAVESMQWCGVCVSCRTGHFNQCEKIELLGFSAPGAFATYAAVNEKYCWDLTELRKVYKEEDQLFEAAALMEPLGCAYNALFVEGGGITPGAYVVVHGAGPIGLATIMLAKACGAAKIIAFDLSEERNQLALAIGADYGINPDDLLEKGSCTSDFVMSVTDGRGADIQVEAAGAASQTVSQINRSLSSHGTMIFLGREDSSASVEFDPLVTQANRLVGARGQAGHGIYPNIIRLIAAGVIEPLKLITARYRFDEVLDAFQRSTLRKDGKIMVRIS